MAGILCQTPRAELRMANAFEPIAETVEAALAAAELDGLPETIVDDIRLALAEALNNVVEHAGGPDLAPQVTLRIWRDRDRAAFCIEDEGRPLPDALLAHAVAAAAAPVQDRLAGAPEPGALPDLDDLPEGGWGLMIIRQCVDRIEARRRDGRNQLLLEKALPAREARG